MAEIRTNAALLRALSIASATPPTPEEMHRQRVSFVMGIVKGDSGITRAQIEEVLSRQDGKRPA